MKRFAAFTCIFAVLAAIVFWGAWGASSVIYSPDDTIRFAASLSENWSAYLNHVVTTGKIQPTDLLFRGLIGSPLLLHELKYAFAAYLAALALVWFLKGRGLSDTAAYGAGLLLGFSGYWLTLFAAGHAGWFVWMSYGVFAFGLIDRGVTRGKWKHWLLLGLVVAWGAFQQPDMWYLFSLLTAAYLVFRLIEAKIFPWQKLFAALAVFTLVSLPNFLSLTDALKGREEQIAGGESGAEKHESAEDRWTFVTNWSLPIGETAEFAVPRINGDTSCAVSLSVNRDLRPYKGALGRAKDASAGNYRQHSLYLGGITILLALVGVFSKKNRDAKFFAVAAAVCIVLSFGRYSEWTYRMFYSLPLGGSIRCPVKWHHLTEFAVAVLAGYGIEMIIGKYKNRRFGARFMFAFVLAQALVLAIEAHRFCAPIDYSQAVRRGMSAQVTILPIPPEYAERSEVLDSVARRYGLNGLVYVAPYHAAPHASVVQILEPLEPVAPKPVKAVPFALGLVSLLSAAFVGVFAFGEKA